MQISLWDPLSQSSCSLVIFTNATKYVSFASTSLYWPLWGCIFKRAGFYSSKEPGVGSRAYIPTCLSVALDEDEGSLQLCFMLCTCKVKDLCNWIYVILLMLLQWLLILYCGAIYWSRECHRYTGILSFDKAGHYRHLLSYQPVTAGPQGKLLVIKILLLIKYRSKALALG
jgi:hypothetical protein